MIRLWLAKVKLKVTVCDQTRELTRPPMSEAQALVGVPAIPRAGGRCLQGLETQLCLGSPGSRGSPRALRGGGGGGGWN